MSNLDRPVGFNMDEAEQLCKEQEDSYSVAYASPVTFGGVTHVHLELVDGDIVVFDKEESYHIEM